MKSAKTYLEEANAVVTRLSSDEAITQHGVDGNLFVDVRDSGDVAKTGTIEGALRIPRGIIEFAADSEFPMYNEALQKQSNIYLICAAGGQAALVGKTLKDMGYEKVFNIGGFSDWKEAGGACES